MLQPPPQCTAVHIGACARCAASTPHHITQCRCTSPKMQAPSACTSYCLHVQKGDHMISQEGGGEHIAVSHTSFQRGQLPKPRTLPAATIAYQPTNSEPRNRSECCWPPTHIQGVLYRFCCALYGALFGCTLRFYAEASANLSLSSLAFTMDGAAAGSAASGLSMKGWMASGLGHTAWPLRMAATLAAARVAMPERVHSDAEAMCGTMTALGQSASPAFMAGSSSNTSSPHLKSGLARRCATSAASSITGPRAALTSTAFFFIMFRRDAFMRWCVALSRLQCSDTTSASLSTSSTVSTRRTATGGSPLWRSSSPYCLM
mmetsp:Transcript_16288/g.40527  ORF Transcript_16288/g.40527 Transcript_16288/m.40527 type:complete len:318 (+) Transcript_16288:174-1127(+)